MKVLANSYGEWFCREYEINDLYEPLPVSVQYAPLRPRIRYL